MKIQIAGPTLKVYDSVDGEPSGELSICISTKFPDAAAAALGPYFWELML